MGKRRTRLTIATAVGLILIVAGTAFVYWPAALIVAGASMVAVGVLSDDGEDS